MATSIKITVDEITEGRPLARSLMTVWDTPRGDVMMALSVGAFNLGPAFEAGDLVNELRFSVHPSLKSKEGINTIKRTALYKNGRPKTEDFLMTKAIKSKEGFQSIFFRIAPIQSTAKSDIENPPDRSISLGQYDPKVSTVMYQILVGSSDVRFPPVREADLAVQQFTLLDYRFVVISSFWAVPALGAGLLVETASLKEGIVGDAPIFGYGCSPKQAIEEFRQFRIGASKHYAASQTKIGVPDIPEARWLMNLPSFTASSDLEKGASRKALRKVYSSVRAAFGKF